MELVVWPENTRLLLSLIFLALNVVYFVLVLLKQYCLRDLKIDVSLRVLCGYSIRLITAWTQIAIFVGVCLMLPCH